MRPLVALAVAALALAAAAPGRAPAPALAPEVVLIAHRGASWDAPEHTFASWDLALDQGADWIEQDLQLTRDGVLVVIHDDSLDRTARGPAASCTGLVRDRSLAELTRCEVGSWFNDEYPERARAEYAGAKIPTLDSVLTRYAGRARFYIELKDPDEAPGMEGALLALLRRHRLAGAGAEVGRVIVQSFSAASLRRMHALEPAVALVQLFEDAIPPDSLALRLEEIAAYAVGIGPSRKVVGARLVAAAHAAGLAVHPYTVNEPEVLRWMLSIGVDGVFTDRPGELRRLSR
ncbi:MAG: glycerophosphodiester phosphodiesterase family protein [Gemmatimonadaceae bacterium]